MFIHRRINSLVVLALVLAAVAVLVVTQVGGGSRATGATSGSAHPVAASQGYPRAVPPILPYATPSELAEIEQSEPDASDYAVPTGTWSTAETNAYATTAK